MKFQLIKDIFTGVLFMIGIYCLIWIGAILDIIYNQ